MTKVLFLPHSARKVFFDDLLRIAKDKNGWQVLTLAVTHREIEENNVVSLDGASRTVYLPSVDLLAKARANPDKELLDLVKSCEAHGGIPINRIILANERDIGAGFTRDAYTFARRGVSKKVLGDSSVAQRIVIEAFRYANDLLEREKPEFILAGNVSSLHHYVLALLASYKNIPLITGRKSKVHSHRTYWTKDLSMLNEETAQLVRDMQAKNHRPSPRSFEILDGFRTKPQTVDYIQQNWKRAARSNFYAKHKGFVMLAITHLLYLIRGSKGGKPKPLFAQIYAFYEGLYLKKISGKYYQTLGEYELSDLKYVYVPLHKEPELAQNFQAPVWHDQLSLIAQLSASMPSGVRLVVREHKFNHGRRPRGYLKKLSQLPNVILIDPFDPQFKYIKHADLVVTDNGSSGWEALIFKRPVLTLANTFYSSIGLAQKLESVNCISQQILSLLSEDPARDVQWDQALAQLIEAEMEVSFPENEEGMANGIEYILQLAAIPEGSALTAVQR